MTSSSSSDGPPQEMEWRGRTGPFTIRVNPGVFAPSHTSRSIAEALEIAPGETVIDVGCGSGVLSFVAARLGAGKVIGCDLSEPAIEVADDNAERLGLKDRVEFRVGDLLEPELHSVLQAQAFGIVVG